MKKFYNVLLYFTFASIFIFGMLFLIFPNEGFFLDALIAMIIFWPSQYIVKLFGLFRKRKYKRELNRVFPNRTVSLSKEIFFQNSGYELDIVNEILGSKSSYTVDEYYKFLKKIKKKNGSDWYLEVKSNDDHHNDSSKQTLFY